MKKEVERKINNSFLELVRNADDYLASSYKWKFIGIIDLAETLGEITYSEYEFLYSAIV